uniref:Uncharacterized protein n=1 Tax=Raphanus sativus TaxID=3726 RepID=A0A650GAL1_RAPSA|nr:hypothetical protein [Raphanus sativus]QGW48438.1 hypothetical protein [Raphanus sativus]
MRSSSSKSVAGSGRMRSLSCGVRDGIDIAISPFSGSSLMVSNDGLSTTTCFLPFILPHNNLLLFLIISHNCLNQFPFLPRCA